MSKTIEVLVPDIGNFKDIPIIELCVKVGDTVKAEDALLTLESDKATIDIPSPTDGVVKLLTVAVGNKVSEGSIVAVIETADPAVETTPAVAATSPVAPSAPLPAPGTAPAPADIECEILVLGGGPGGYSAAFRSADLGMKTVIVERYGKLGGVCLNVGCIPSKALLHVAAVMDEAAHLSSTGVTFTAPTVDLDALRAHKEKVVGKLTTGLAGMAKMRKVDVVRGYGTFLDANRLEVEITERCV